MIAPSPFWILAQPRTPDSEHHIFRTAHDMSRVMPCRAAGKDMTWPFDRDGMDAGPDPSVPSRKRRSDACGCIETTKKSALVVASPHASTAWRER
jgi:hypothetical protein